MKLIFSPGVKLILIYVFFFIIIAGIGYEFIGFEAASDWYIQIKWDKFALVLFFIVVFMSLISTKHSVKYKFVDNIPIRFQIVVILILTIISFFGFISGNSAFRYSNEGISESGWLVLLLSSTNTIFNFFLMLYIFYKPSYINKRKIENIILLLLFLLGLFFSINGNASSLLLLMFVFSVLFPKLFNSLMFKEKRNYFLIFLIFCFCFPILYAVNIYGESIKMGVSIFDVLDEHESIELFSFYSKYIFGFVLSPNYLSLKMNLCNFFLSTDYDYFFNNLLIPFKNLLFRFDRLFNLNLGIKKDEISSLSRLNYINITESLFLKSREGTTPGLFASFFLCFPFPLNFVLLYFSLKIIRKYVDILCFAMNSQLSIFGFVVFLYFFILPILSSPFDLLTIIDNIVIYFVLFVLFIKYCIKRDA